MRNRNRLGYLFAIGFLLSFVYLKYHCNTGICNLDIWEKDVLISIQKNAPEGRQLFFYVLLKRLPVFVFWTIIATTYLGCLCSMLGAGWYGFSSGVYLITGICTHGIRGIFLVLLSVFPQCLIFAPMLYYLLVWCDETCKQIYGKTKAPVLSERVLKLVGLFGMLLGGSILESFVNPVLFKNLIGLFVG